MVVTKSSPSVRFSLEFTIRRRHAMALFELSSALVVVDSAFASFEEEGARSSPSSTRQPPNGAAPLLHCASSYVRGSEFGGFTPRLRHKESTRWANKVSRCGGVSGAKTDLRRAMRMKGIQLCVLIFVM